MFLQLSDGCAGARGSVLLVFSFIYFFEKRFASIYKSLNLERQTGLSFFFFFQKFFILSTMCVWKSELSDLETRGEGEGSVCQFEMFYIF